MTNASREYERLALAVPGDILKDPIDRFMELVSDMLGEVEREEVNAEDILELVPLGGLKISLASSS